VRLAGHAVHQHREQGQRRKVWIDHRSVRVMSTVDDECRLTPQRRWCGIRLSWSQSNRGAIPISNFKSLGHRGIRPASRVFAGVRASQPWRTGASGEAVVPRAGQ
jgi:hypothetical protein